MATIKEDKTAAVAEQLGSMSLGASVESKGDPENNKDAEKNEAPTKFVCSWCGKKSDTHKKCRNCKCVWYCGKECQNRHWKEHKIECRRVKKELDKRGGKLDLGTEMDLGPVSDLPPREECPICMHALPIHTMLSSYEACCGKIFCNSCAFQHGESTCAFCREPMPESDEEILLRLRKRVKHKDPKALFNMAMGYGYGAFGLSVDEAKCIDLLRESARLGLPGAQCHLGSFHHMGGMGLEQNEEEAIKYWEKAAEGGHVIARHNLGYMEGRKGNHDAAMCHLRLSASGGLKKSMKSLIIYFEDGLLRHGDLAETLQVMYLASAEMKSEYRDKYIEHLKKTGEYKPEFVL